MNPKVESKKKNTLPTRFAFQRKKLNSKLKIEQNQQNLHLTRKISTFKQFCFKK